MANIIVRWLANRTSLQDAVRGGKLVIVRAKLEGGLSPEEINDCIGYGQHKGLAMVQVLVEHGANVNHKLGENRTRPLHLAATCGYVDIAAYLIAQGAQVNAVNAEGDTPLDRAFIQPFTEAYWQVNGVRAIPEDGARSQRQRRVAELLVKHGARGGHTLPPHLWGPIKSRVRPLVLLARTNFPFESADVLVDKIVEKFDLQYEDGTPPERRALIQRELRELVSESVQRQLTRAS